MMVAALWLPWHSSGERSRNAFDLSVALDRLDLDPVVLGDLWGWTVPLVPLLGAAAWVAFTMRWDRALVITVLLVALIAGLPASVGLGLDELREPGEMLALVGLAVVAAGLWRMRRRRPHPVNEPDRGGTADGGSTAPTESGR